MKKKILLALLLILSLTGCNKKEEKTSTDEKIFHDVVQVNPYLYEIAYDDYVYDSKFETVTNVEDFACSSVKNGNYYGRNFDFIFNDNPEFIVKVNASEKRFGSVGVSILSAIHEGDNIENNFNHELEILPNMMLDGINDQGVICSCNVVPRGDVAEVTGTNPSGEDLNSSFIVRYILDNATSADDAIELLKKRNIYGSVGEYYNLHFMIADKDKTYVVEFIDNKMVAEEKYDNEQIMTNYYVNLDEYTENAAGIERYQILKNNYNEGSTFEGMWNLMQRVKYSTAYLYDNDPQWVSEFLPQSSIQNIDSPDIQEYIHQITALKQNYWIARTYNQRKPANESYWLTTHNSTYDIVNQKLRVTVQEDYNNYYEYTLKN